MDLTKAEKKLLNQHKNRVKAMEKSRRDLEMDISKHRREYRSDGMVKYANLAQPGYGTAMPFYVQDIEKFEFVHKTEDQKAAYRKLIEDVPLTEEEEEARKNDKNIMVNRAGMDKLMEPAGERYFFPVREQDRFSDVRKEKSYINQLYEQSDELRTHYIGLRAIESAHTDANIFDLNDTRFDDYRAYGSRRWWAPICGEHFYKKNKKKAIKNLTKKKRKAILEIQRQSSELCMPLMELYRLNNEEKSNARDNRIKGVFARENKVINLQSANRLLKQKDSVFEGENALQLDTIENQYFIDLQHNLTQNRKGKVEFSPKDLFLPKEGLSKAAKNAAKDLITATVESIRPLTDLFTNLRNLSGEYTERSFGRSLERLAREYSELNLDDRKRTSLYSSYFSKKNMRITLKDPKSAYVLLMSCVAQTLQNTLDSTGLENAEINPTQYGYINAINDHAKLAASMITVNSQFTEMYANNEQEVSGERSGILIDRMESLSKQYPVLAKYESTLCQKFGADITDKWTENQFIQNAQKYSDDAIKTEEAINVFLEGQGLEYSLGSAQEKENIREYLRIKDGFNVMNIPEVKAYFQKEFRGEKALGVYADKLRFKNAINSYYKKILDEKDPVTNEPLYKSSFENDSTKYMLEDVKNVIINVFKAGVNRDIINALMEDEHIQSMARKQNPGEIRDYIDNLEKQYQINHALLDEALAEENLPKSMTYFVKNQVISGIGVSFITGSVENVQAAIKDNLSRTIEYFKEEGAIAAAERLDNICDVLILDEKGKPIISQGYRNIMMEHIFNNRTKEESMIEALGNKEEFTDEGLAEFIKSMYSFTKSAETSFHQAVTRGRDVQAFFAPSQVRYLAGNFKDLFITTPFNKDAIEGGVFKEVSQSLIKSDTYMKMGGAIGFNLLESEKFEKENNLGLKNLISINLSDEKDISEKGAKQLAEYRRQLEEKDKFLLRADPHALSASVLDRIKKYLKSPKNHDPLLLNSEIMAGVLPKIIENCIESHDFDEKLPFMDSVESKEDMKNLSIANLERLEKSIINNFISIMDFMETKDVKGNKFHLEIYLNLLPRIVTGKFSEMNFDNIWAQVSEDLVNKSEAVEKRFLVYANMTVEKPGDIKTGSDIKAKHKDLQDRKERHFRAYKLWDNIRELDRTQNSDMEDTLLRNLSVYIQLAENSDEVKKDGLEPAMKKFAKGIFQKDDNKTPKAQALLERIAQEAENSVDKKEYKKLEEYDKNISQLSEKSLETEEKIKGIDQKIQDLLAEKRKKDESLENDFMTREYESIQKSLNELNEKKNNLLKDNMEFLIAHYLKKEKFENASAKDLEKSMEAFSFYDFAKTYRERTKPYILINQRDRFNEKLSQKTRQLNQLMQEKTEILNMQKVIERGPGKYSLEELNNHIRHAVNAYSEKTAKTQREREFALEQIKEFQGKYDKVKKKIGRKGPTDEQKAHMESYQYSIDSINAKLTEMAGLDEKYQNNLDTTVNHMNKFVERINLYNKAVEEIKNRRPLEVIDKEITSADGEVQSLKEEVDSYTREIDAFTENITKDITPENPEEAKRFNEIRKELSRIDDGISDVELTLKDVVNIIKSHGNEIPQIKAEIADLEDRIREQESQRAMLSSEKELINSDISKNQELKGLANKYIDSFKKAKREELRDKYNDEMNRAMKEDLSLKYTLGEAQANKIRDFFAVNYEKLGYESLGALEKDFPNIIGEFLFCQNAGSVFSIGSDHENMFTQKDEKQYKKDMFSLGRNILNKQYIVQQFLAEKALTNKDITTEELDNMSYKMRNIILKVQETGNKEEDQKANLNKLGFTSVSEVLDKLWNYRSEDTGLTIFKQYNERIGRLETAGFERLLPVLNQNMEFWEKIIATGEKSFEEFLKDTMETEFGGMRDALKEKEGEMSEGISGLINSVFLATTSLEDYRGKNLKESRKILGDFTDNYLKTTGIEKRLLDVANSHKDITKDPFAALFAKLIESGQEGTDFLSDDKEFKRIRSKYEKRVKSNIKTFETALKTNEIYTVFTSSSNEKLIKARQSTFRNLMGEYCMFNSEEVFKGKVDQFIESAVMKVSQKESAITMTMDEYAKLKEQKVKDTRDQTARYKIKRGEIKQEESLTLIRQAAFHANRGESPLLRTIKSTNLSTKKLEKNANSIKKALKEFEGDKGNDVTRAFLQDIISERFAGIDFAKTSLEKLTPSLSKEVDGAMEVYEKALDQFKAGPELNRFMMYVYSTKNEENDIAKLSKEYNAINQSIKELREITKNHEDMDEAVKGQLLSDAQALEYLMFNSDYEQFSGVLAQRKRYYENLVVLDGRVQEALRNYIEEDPNYKGIFRNKEDKEAVVLGFRAYFREDLLSEDFKAPEIKYLIRDTGFINEITQKNFDENQVRSGEFFEKKMETDVSAEDFDKFMAENLGYFQKKRYKNLTPRRKKALLLALSAPQLFQDANLSNSARLVSLEKDMEKEKTDKVSGEVLKALNGVESMAVSYGAIQNVLYKSLSLFGTDIFDRALKYVGDCEKLMVTKRTKEEWEKINDGRMSLSLIEKDLMGEKKEQINKMRKDLSNLTDHTSFKTMLVEQLKAQGLDSLAKKIDTDNFDTRTFVTILQNRSILDKSTAKGRGDQIVNPLMRRRLLKEMSGRGKGFDFVMENSHKQNLIIAMENIYSYQVRDDITTEGRRLFKSDLLESSVTRRTAIDAELITGALSMMDELKELKNSMGGSGDFDFHYNRLHSEDKSDAFVSVENHILQNPTLNEDYDFEKDFMRKDRILMENNKLTIKFGGQKEYEEAMRNVEDNIRRRKYMDLVREKQIKYNNKMTDDEKVDIFIANAY